MKNKSDKNILIAFFLNLFFSLFELFGGLFSNSISIMSDAIHDFGDSISIGISYFLEKVSKKKPDKNYTFGYVRYSILGAFITNSILICGSVLMIITAVNRLFNESVINYDGMFYIALFGVVVNFLAAYFTKEGDSLNQKAVNLHMLEDVMGWVVVLIGSVVIKYTKINYIDSILSIGVSTFVLFHAINGFKEILDLFLEKVPNGVSLDKVKRRLKKLEHVIDIHHIHIWSMDMVNNFLTLHVVTDCKSKDYPKLKSNIRMSLKEIGINNVTIEIEDKDDVCMEPVCNLEERSHTHHHNH